jgi:hypothetical protein
MTFTDYLEITKARNRKLWKGDKLLITPSELERVMREAFDAGYSEGKKEDAPSVFEAVFGKTKV